MSLEFNKEKKQPSVENLEDKTYKEMLVAEAEVDRLLEQIMVVFGDDEESIKKFEKLSPLMDEAMKRSSETIGAWHKAVEDAYLLEKGKIDNMIAGLKD